MPLTLAAMEALINDNTSGDISAADMRSVIQSLFNHGSGALAQRGDLSSAHADDDEFNTDGSGAPAGWTFVQDSTPRSSIATRFGKLHWYNQGTIGAGGNAEGIVKAVPSGPPLTVEGIFQFPPEQRASTMAGVVLMNSTGNVWTTGDGLFFGAFNAASEMKVTVRAVTNWTIGSAIFDESLTSRGDWMYLRLVWVSANVFTALMSSDGVTWKKEDQYESQAFTLTPAFMGVAWTPFASAANDPSLGAIHAFRVYASAKTEGID